jgi:hypothetical protein
MEQLQRYRSLIDMAILTIADAGPGDRRLITPLPVDASGTIAVPPRADLHGGAVPAPPPMITGSPPGVHHVAHRPGRAQQP